MFDIEAGMRVKTLNEEMWIAMPSNMVKQPYQDAIILIDPHAVKWCSIQWNSVAKYHNILEIYDKPDYAYQSLNPKEFGKLLWRSPEITRKREKIEELRNQIGVLQKDIETLLKEIG